MESLPKDDGSNWLFLLVGDQRFSFVYKIEKPETARYDESFTVSSAFTFPELVKNSVEINKVYTIMRGEEIVGSGKIFKIQGFITDSGRTYPS